MNNEYVLVTAAYNEDRFIARTLESVLHQTIAPKCWVIVSDGSTDRTDEIVKDYAARHGFIRFMRREKAGERNFSAKVLALQQGLRALADVEYSFYCTLDADVSFGEGYFQAVLRKFHENPGLGIAGGTVLDFYDGAPHRRIASLSSVAGAVQFFRRECFLSTGGFVPSSIGGEDAVLEIKAMKNGWTVQSFPELQVFHYRRTGAGNGSRLKSRFNYGILDYCLGNTLLFEFLKCLRRLAEGPFFLASAARFSGYAYSLIRKPARLLCGDELFFARSRQHKRIIGLLK
jgi:glycosyltransferase involved in cell wall biosynthesis